MTREIAIIEFGSNAIRMVEFQIIKNDFSEISLNRIPQRLIENLGKKRVISDKTINKVSDIVNNFVNSITTNEIYAIATAALRTAENKNEFIAAILQRTKLKIEIIPSDKEAYYDFLAVEHKLNLSDVLIADIGGGSTELIGVKNNEILGEVSLPVGGVNITNQYFTKIPISNSEEKVARQDIRQKLSELGWLENFSQPMVLLGGASIVLFKIMRETGFVDSKALTKTIAELKQLDIQQLKEYNVIPPGTVDVINGGMVIVDEIMKYATPTEVTTIKASVREGYILEKLRTPQ